MTDEGETNDGYGSCARALRGLPGHHARQDTSLHVLWSVDHTTWDVMNNRVILQWPVCDDDLAAIVAFHGRIGVMWSNQTGTGAEAHDHFGFRFRVDKD